MLSTRGISDAVMKSRAMSPAENRPIRVPKTMAPTRVESVSQRDTLMTADFLSPIALRTPSSQESSLREACTLTVIWKKVIRKSVRAIIQLAAVIKNMLDLRSSTNLTTLKAKTLFSQAIYMSLFVILEISRGDAVGHTKMLSCFFGKSQVLFTGWFDINSSQPSLA